MTPPRANEHGEEATVLVAARDRRTPVPQRVTRPPTVPPPLPAPPPGSHMMPPQSSMAGPSARPAAPPKGGAVPSMLPIQAPPTPMPTSGPAMAFAPAPPGPYASWGPPIAARLPPRDATPTSQDSYDRPVLADRPSMPQVMGWQRARKTMLKPWMLIVGAVLMALVAFLITRMFIR
jgi:hypothetical protein